MKTYSLITKINSERINTVLADSHEEAVVKFSIIKQLSIEYLLHLFDVSENC